MAPFHGGAPIFNNVPSQIDLFFTDYPYLRYFSRFCLEFKKVPLINTFLTDDSSNQNCLKWEKIAHFYGGAPIFNNVPSWIDPFFTDYLYLKYFWRFCSEYKKVPLINTVLTIDSSNQNCLKWGKMAHFYGGAPIFNNVPSRIDPFFTDYLHLRYFLRFCSEYK